MGPDQNFAVRKNEDGSTDSICLRCFQNRRTARTDAELKQIEIDHICRIANIPSRSWVNYAESDELTRWVLSFFDSMTVRKSSVTMQIL